MINKLTRRSFLARASCAFTAPAVLARRRPNILLFFPDQHRFDWTGLNPDLDVRTPHLVSLARRGVAVCWETAGTCNPKLLDQAVELSLETGGCIKFDLKAYDRALYQALTGGSNEAVLENFVRASRRFRVRPEPPLVVASTLLVPGYVDAAEVGRIARFIAGVDPDIPYALLGFAPQFAMSDLPPTSVRHAEEALEEARRAGLRRVRIGNRHLLGRDY